MDMIWSPPPDDADPWRSHASRLAAQPCESGDDAQAWRDSGLAALLGGEPSAVAVLTALEGIAAARPRLSLMLAGAWAGAAALIQPSPKKKGRRAATSAATAFPVCPVDAFDPATGLPAFTITAEGRAWRLRGSANCLGPAADPGAALLIYAHHADAPGSVSCALLPAASAGMAGAGPKDAPGGQVHIDTLIGASLWLGPVRGAQAAMRRTNALRRIAAAAQACGVGLAAYEGARLALPASGSGAVPARAALELAGCASALSAARMMLYEAARAAQANKDIHLLSAMALLSAGECAERLLASAFKIAAEQTRADPQPLQALLQARQQHLATAGPLDAQAALLARAIAPPPLHPPLGVHSNMRNPTTSAIRPDMPPGRVAEILDAAATAFTQQSYDSTTLDQIGDVLGVTKGTIYHHYRSKAHLFAAVYQRAMEMNIETITPIATQDGVRAVDRLYRMAYAHSMQVMRHLSYQRIAVQGLESHLMGRVSEDQRARLAEVISLRDHYEELFVNVMAQAMEAGELPRQNPRLAVKPLFGAINWTTMWYQPRPGETAADRDRLATHLATFVLSGLTQAHQPAEPPVLASNQEQQA
ncbi:TetR family transcriptional regulator [Achromobacter sp. NPDC058515]|uniref:TetR family transcriptional regulator n=1 Tax=Achromobacter sp. NPDC058515 TaxID=3346533 RepID=UPI0036507EA8